MNTKFGLFAAIFLGAGAAAFAATPSTITYMAGDTDYVGPTGMPLGSYFILSNTTVTAGCELDSTGYETEPDRGAATSLNIAGLTLDTTTNITACSITGTPTSTTNGTELFEIENLATTGTTANYVTNIQITITPTSLVYPQNPATYTVGLPIAANTPSINATGVTAGAITYAVSSGSLPAGLTLNASTGAITGTPSGAPGTSTVTITATDGSVNGVNGATYTAAAGGKTSNTLQFVIQAPANYSAYKYTRSIVVNTAAMTTALATTQVNFPLLVRLTSANFDFTKTLGTGADIRFAATRGNNVSVALPYQIERWDSANGVAEVWVNVDSVYNSAAPNAATQSITMYFGNSAATSASNGALVFSPYNGFQGTWHMDGNSTTSTSTGIIEPDVTGNNLHMQQVGTGPTYGVGYIGLAATNFTANNFLSALGTGSAPTGYGTPVAAGAGSAVDFPMLSSYTISAWANPGTISGTYNNQAAILSRGNQDYQLQSDAGKWENTQLVYYKGFLTSSTYNTYENNQASASITTGWHYVVGEGVNGPGLKQASQNIYVDGAAVSHTNGSTAGVGYDGGTRSARLNNLDLSIGQYPVAATGNGNNSSWYGTGGTNGGTAGTAYLDEITVSNVTRSADWVQLNFETQCNTNTAPSPTSCPATNLVTVGSLANNVVAPAIVTSPASQSTTVGSSVNFSVVVTGSTPLVYEWLHSHGGTTDTLKKDTLSALTDTLKLTNVPQADTGSFSVYVINSAGNATSGKATLTITAGPGITSSPASATVILGGNVKFGVSISGTSSTPLTYKWMHLHGGVTDTLKKDTTSLFTDTLALTSIPQADTGSYEVFVSNSAGSATSQPGVLSIYSVPSAPTITSVKGASGQITVYWTTPASNGSAITGYKVTSVQDTSKHCTSTAADSCIVTGLTNTTSYSFTVVATNLAGNSAPSAASTATTNVFSFTSKTGFGLQMAGSTMLLHMPQVSGNVRVSILDMWGRTVWNRSVSGDIGQLTWNGNSNQGTSAPVGMYVLRLTFEKGASNPVGAIQTTFVKQ